MLLQRKAQAIYQLYALYTPSHFQARSQCEYLDIYQLEVYRCDSFRSTRFRSSFQKAL